MIDISPAKGIFPLFPPNPFVFVILLRASYPRRNRSSPNSEARDRGVWNFQLKLSSFSRLLLPATTTNSPPNVDSPGWGGRREVGREVYNVLQSYYYITYYCYGTFRLGVVYPPGSSAGVAFAVAHCIYDHITCCLRPFGWGSYIHRIQQRGSLGRCKLEANHSHISCQWHEFYLRSVD